jgi:hypothetical protein
MQSMKIKYNSFVAAFDEICCQCFCTQSMAIVTVLVAVIEGFLTVRLGAEHLMDTDMNIA